MADHENSTIEEVVGVEEVERKGGELECLKEMPVDILLEIFVNLDPIDLLHLSSASKGLREILTSPSALYLWHQVRNTSSSCIEQKFTNCVRLTITYKAHVQGHHPARMMPILFCTQNSCTKLTARWVPHCLHETDF
jgi:hypothetical protein